MTFLHVLRVVQSKSALIWNTIFSPSPYFHFLMEHGSKDGFNFLVSWTGVQGGPATRDGHSSHCRTVSRCADTGYSTRQRNTFTALPTNVRNASRWTRDSNTMKRIAQFVRTWTETPDTAWRNITSRRRQTVACVLRFLITRLNLYVTQQA